MSLLWNKDLEDKFPMTTEEVSGGSYRRMPISFDQQPNAIVTAVWLHDAANGDGGHLFEVHEDGSIGEEQHVCRPPSDVGAFWASTEEFWQCPDCQERHYPHADFWWEMSE